MLSSVPARLQVGTTGVSGGCFIAECEHVLVPHRAEQKSTLREEGGDKQIRLSSVTRGGLLNE